jgi:hypothetical protein
MTNNLEAAINDLTIKLQNQINEVTETKRAINVLLRMVGKDPAWPDESPEQVRVSINIAPDQYYGRPLATCVQEFLEQRKKFTGKQAIDVAEILKALEQGGFDFKAQGWRENDRLRSLSISLAKNTKVFHRLPNQMFGLLSWYPDVTAKKERADKAEQPTEAEAEQEGSNANAA